MVEVTLQVNFFGRVQGVGFRYVVVRAAEKFKLRGWVRNSEKEDVVEACLQGEEKNIFAAIENLKANFGAIRIDKVVVDEVKGAEKFKGFEVKY